jgi:hypothetical protein
MDPNANLQEQERILDRFSASTGTLDKRTRNIIASLSTDHERLWDLRQALYDWIRDGGFQPDWTLAPNAAKYYGKG